MQALAIIGRYGGQESAYRCFSNVKQEFRLWIKTLANLYLWGSGIIEISGRIENIFDNQYLHKKASNSLIMSFVRMIAFLKSTGGGAFKAAPATSSGLILILPS